MSKNNTIKLEFNVNENLFWEILCRLKKRVNASLYFAAVVNKSENKLLMVNLT